ncbi:MAG: hypothetical protein U9Q82_13915 [Chloroflexota bacterium]|nr:hypothetical protein [Chloroflexota bacterium]
MLFKVDQDNKSIKTVEGASWAPEELDLEKYILPAENSDDVLLNKAIFSDEEFLVIGNQITVPGGKRADILALDSTGSLVIIELKRKEGHIGVDMQALQYLAACSTLKGQTLIDYFCKKYPLLQENIEQFREDSFQIEDINQQSRIILVAQHFDTALFSMGEWLSSKGTAFRCIQYFPFAIGDKHLLGFSIAFDRSPDPLYGIQFHHPFKHTTTGYFWHNIGKPPTDKWWKTLVKRGEIPTGFQNQPGDQGEKTLKRYIKGDTIIAYASDGPGAIGWGIIDDPNSYQLLKPSENDRLDNRLCHRLSITWEATASTLSDGVSYQTFNDKFDLYFPRRTSVRIKDKDKENAKKLTQELSQRFSSE